MMPSPLFISRFVHAIIHTMSENTTSTIISMIFSCMNAIGLMADAIPSTMSMLKMHEPTAFPSAISTSFFLAATIDVTSSGSDVPIDTMVSPTSVRLIPRSIAMRLALSTTTSPPTAIPTAPIRMKITAFWH